MRRYKPRKLYAWNHNLGYIAGIMASDGCLYRDGRHLNITSKDIDLLETIRSILNLRGTYKQKVSGFGKIGYYVQFSDVALYDFLLECGIGPAKSKTIGKLIIPDIYYGDFLRGYFDGDGHTYSYWDTRWQKSLMYYTGFSSASPVFLDWLKNTNQRLIGTVSGAIKPGKRASTLLYAKTDSRLLYAAMYHNRNVPHLHRKKQKIDKLLQNDPFLVK